jgi:hypothetical protein
MFAFSELIIKPAVTISPDGNNNKTADKKSFPSKSAIELVND